MAISITLLIMSNDKTHETNQSSMRHSKYDIVGVFPLRQLQKQEKNFYTINLLNSPFDSIEDACTFILEPVFEETIGRNTIESKLLNRRKFKFDITLFKTAELSKLTSKRHLSIQWTRYKKLIKDVSLD